MSPRRGGGIVLAAAIVLANASASPLPALAATPDLSVIGDATYEVVPGERLVRVRVELVAQNHLRDTAARRYTFDRAYLAVPPGTTAFRVTAPAGRPTVRISRRTGYQLLTLGFGQRLAAGKSARFTLTFDLPDGGGSSAGDVRVGEAFASFPVWAYGYPNGSPGGMVRIAFPAGYEARLLAGELPAPTTDSTGRTIFQSGRLADVTSFSAWFVAERTVAMAESSIGPVVGGSTAAIAVRAWPDDPGWATRVGGLLERGVPALWELVGLDWTMTAPLTVEETAGTIGGHVGVFDPAAGRIEIAWHADSFVVLHEAAHAWFNGRLLADRWANEAFASYYAVAAGAGIDEPVAAPELTTGLLRARIPLNAWSARDATDPARRAQEDYAYAASLGLARAIAERAGAEGLRRAWRAAGAGEAAYQPPNVDAGTGRPPELAAGPPDWRGLLDLLEDRTGATYDDLWREWVVRPDDLPLLDARAATRAHYEAVIRSAGRWELPRAIRDALRAWQFARAETLLGEAEGLLSRRAELERAAADARLSLPTRLEVVFEGDGGFAAATAEAEAEAATIEALVAAEAARPMTAPDGIEQLGLLGEDPETELAAAREAFSSGDLAAAASGASDAYGAWAGAAETGRGRVLAGIGAAILAALAILVTVPRARAWRVGRRDDAIGPASTEPPSVA